MKIEIMDQIREEDRETIFQGLLAYNLSKIENKEPKDLAVYLLNDEGEKTAGLIADTHGNWLSVKYLWVSEELRGQNLGSQLLEHAEKEAVERGCKFSFLDTFGFQAPGFYIKHGYKEVFALENYPVSGSRHYYTKDLI